MMSKELIGKSVRQLFAELACNIYHYDIRPSLYRFSRTQHERIRDCFEQIYASINWSSRHSVLPIVPLFEEIYCNAPKDSLNRHQQIEQLLQQEGYTFTAGKLVRIRHSLNECR